MLKNKLQLKEIGKVGLKIGKQIVIDGTKSLALKGAIVTIDSVFNTKGFSDIKNIKLDDVLKGDRKIVEKVISKD